MENVKILCFFLYIIKSLKATPLCKATSEAASLIYQRQCQVQDRILWMIYMLVIGFKHSGSLKPEKAPELHLLKSHVGPRDSSVPKRIYYTNDDPN